MKNDFDTIIDRKALGSGKWAVGENELPLTVADMEFSSPEPVIGALTKRVAQGSYGYADIEEGWAEAYISFYKDLYGWDSEKDSLHFVTSVVASIYALIGALSKEGDQVILISPVYHHFYSPIVNSDRNVREVPFLYDNGVYSIDWEALEIAASEEKSTLLILCNPHNPIGKIFSKEELLRIVDICRRHGVIIADDEIHGPLTSPGHKYVPLLSLPGNEDIVVTTLSPSKSFNLAGLHSAAIIAPNLELRRKILAWLDKSVYEDPNVLSCLAAKVAYNEGRQWLEEANEYIHSNRLYVDSFLKQRLPELRLVYGEATYLLWIDCNEVTHDSADFVDFLRGKTGLILSPGVNFGTGGEGFVRMNVACPRSMLIDALERLEEGVKSYKEK